MKILLGFSFLVLGLMAYGQEEPVRVSSWVMRGLLLAPAQADCAMTHDELLTMYRTRGSGSVTASITISETGHVEEVTLQSGSPGLAEACMRGWQSWVFKPYLVDGRAVRVSTIFTTHFQFGAPDAELQRELDKPGFAPEEFLFCGGKKAGDGAFHRRVSSGEMAGRLLSRPDPVFAPFPPGSHVSGSVVMRACISKAGAVEKTQVISGPEALRQEIAKTVSRWKYRPYLLDGVAIPVETHISMSVSFGGGS